MKYIYTLFMVMLLFPVVAGANEIEDDSIITQLDRENAQELSIDFGMKSFDSCDVFEDVMEDYIKSYWENNYKNGRNILYSPGVLELSVQSEAEVLQDSALSPVAKGGSGDDFSQTNTQVVGVDESDIVKTDGKYHYYYNQTQAAVYIVESEKAGFFSDEGLKIVKKIKLPKSFYDIQLYVTDGRLVVIASSYSQTDYSKRGYYINRNAKTYTVVFDTTDINAPQLIKLYSSDGNYSESRRIGDYVYVLSQNYFSYPYYNIKNIDDIEIEAEKLIPKRLDVSRTDDVSEQNLTIKDTSYPYKISSGDIADCSSISYSFPDEETIKNTGFNPGYNIISAINIAQVDQEVTTQVIAGSNSEVYMSSDNLYMTEGIWQQNNFTCPPNALCAMPFFWGGTQNTLIHKLNIDKQNISYQDSGLVPGSPLNQYSMDEHNGNFRIITSQWSPERSTGVYILDEDLNAVSNLENLAPGESFRSSRFIGDKLFLVTFEQIDPLFAIDLTNIEDPKVLGELKIPGFSTYLHPYDENHLIGLGYDTKINEWGGTTTAGVKVDLYKINYDKHCGDDDLTAVQEEKCESGDYKGIIVEQLYTQTIGGKGSYSEALNNPRMFVWNSDRNTLLLPVTLYEKDDSWRTQDYYNGLFSIGIDKDSGIQVKNRATHIDVTGIEEERLEECSQYTQSGEPICRETINGEIICEEENQYDRYVPNYCFADTTLWAYIGDKSWEYNTMQIKRALYIGDSVYAISDDKITSHDWELDETSSLDFE